MIEYREVPVTIHHPEWRNEAEGWKATTSIYDGNDPGRQIDGHPAFRGSSVMTIDSSLVPARHMDPGLPHDAMVAGSEREALAQRVLAQEAFARHVLAQLADADPERFGRLADLPDLRYDARAMCTMCPCTPGVVLGTRWSIGLIQYDIDISALS